ncbi:MAG: hypothetical protein Q7U54_03675 [Bacteroidales bacterium]|nr:hypothetical protein [Bacteroidales bacterium]
MAKFKQGKSGNKRGRPKGAGNKIAVSLKGQLSNFLNEKVMELPAIWLKLSPRDKVAFLKDLLPFFLQKLQSINVEVELEKLTDEQLEILCNKLFSKQRDEEN